MFSGIVADVGRVRAVAEAPGGGLRLEIGTAYDTATIALGASVDRIEWFRAPGAIGADGVPALAALGVGRATDMARFARVSSTSLGEDVLDTLVPAG